MRQANHSRGRRRAFSVFALVALVLPLSAAAQLRTGGKGGGLPGGPGNPADPRSGGGSAVDDPALIQHVLSRLTFGATQADVDLIKQIGVENWIRLQLEPDLIPEDPALGNKMALLPEMYTAVGDPQYEWLNLYSEYVLRARYSNRQLQQVMTEFWSNHFDTGLPLTNGGAAGFYTSMAFDPATGYPAVCYYNNASRRPDCSFWDGSDWQWYRAENEFLTGWYTSLAYNPVSGQPSIAYYNEASNDRHLEFKYFDGSSWLPAASADQIVDDTADVGHHASLGFDAAGTAFIAYHDLDNGQLKVASGAPTTWTSVVVDGGGDHASLAMQPSDRPAVAYVDGAGQLAYASYDGVAWQTEVIAPGVGFEHASLAFDGAGDPAVAYYDSGAQQPMLARKSGPAWATEVVDATAGVGTHTSLAINAAGNPAIAYHEGAPGYNLRLATWNGASFDVEIVVDDARITGEWAALGFDPATDEPLIASYDGSRFEVRLESLDTGTWLYDRVYGRGTSRFLYTIWEKLETDAFRDNALGSFRDLLEASATSAAMMLFLNNDLNVAGNGNENYARELLELHTVGVDGGYSQLDVETAAEALTGWTTIARISPASCEVQQDYFCYNHNGHDGRARTIMGQDFADDSADDPANYRKQGSELLDFLSVHPETARFICHKLLQKFVADAPPDRLWGECQQTFVASAGDMLRVMQTILLSPEFLEMPEYRLNKVRDPFEFTLAAARSLGADTDLYALWSPANNMGMPLFRQDVPTGWPEAGDEWVSTNSFLQRWRYADQLTHSQVASVSYEPYTVYVTAVDPYAMVRPFDIVTAEGVVEFFVQRLLHGEAGPGERFWLIDCLSNGNPASFDIDDSQTPNRMRDMVGVMLGYPIFNKN